MRTTALLTFSIALVTGVATAADFSQVSLQPYVLVASHLVIPHTFQPDILFYEEQQLFITQGGATFSSFSAQVEQEIPTSEVARGIATRAQLLGLRNELNSANIRAQRSCEADTLGSQSGYTDLTWYSIRGKRNTFRIVFARRGESGLPPCRETSGRITSALRNFYLAVLQNPDSEILLTPP